ncbi:class II fructose-bisphosphate aldolase [Microbacterium sp. EF45047]|uniref:class II fructose-bisphosphate aldolase n=1 Tax=Microbacterium sp. EF45047 TaxID=2809708 RepID=UPI002349680B|nr:class II fructose-bisphosphate aldolase [Microbacterium sp. EF45047]WCM55946.1 class II fructose-bisphosphate aldolase [Microbacterium sp. EF45047]
MTVVSPGRIIAEHGRVAAVNVIQLEHAEAIAAASVRTGLPVVLQISENTAAYHGGLAPIALAVLRIAADAPTPIAVHLDHAEREDLVYQAIDLGIPSVMFDASKSEDAENRRRTAAVAERAHAGGVWVEAELGEIGGKDGAHAPGVRTDPGDAARFVADTGVDALAVAVGSSHAMAERTARLDFGLIAALARAVPVPLVLHGSSGVADADIQQAIAHGMRKINIATHVNGVFTRAVREALLSDGRMTDPRAYLGPGRDAAAGEVARLLTVIGEAPAADLS